MKQFIIKIIISKTILLTISCFSQTSNTVNFTKNLLESKRQQLTNVIILSNCVITAYCPCYKCCPKSSKGLNASGKKPLSGSSVAGPRSLRLGTKVIIAGHTYTVDDRLAKRYDSRFDIYFNTHREALQFGIKTQQVTVITP